MQEQRSNRNPRSRKSPVEMFWREILIRARALIEATAALPICQVGKVRGLCRGGEYHHTVYPSGHGNFLKNIPSPKGEKSTAQRRQIEGRWLVKVTERVLQTEKGGQPAEGRGQRRGGGGNSGVHRPHWQQQWQPPHRYYRAVGQAVAFTTELE